MNDEPIIGICPRCGRELVRGTTPTGKVCFRCFGCGGVAVTLPALRESLDARSIAALTKAARAAEHVGCICPGCGGRMSLLKVGDGIDKIEIDVCGHCLSIWCDKGEYETLAPQPSLKSSEVTMRQFLERTSLETRERYAAMLLESLPEDVSFIDFNMSDILRDVVRLVVGAPTLWRTVRPVSPIFAIVITLALPIAQAFVYGSCYDDLSTSFRYRQSDFWYIDVNMAGKCGFDLSSPLNLFSFPFVQASGRTALWCAILLFIPLVVIERRIGHAKFVKLFIAFMVVSAVAHALFIAMGLATGILCGIVPVALGFLAYASFAWPDLRIKGQIGPMSVYAIIVGMGSLMLPLLSAMTLDFLSFGFGPIVACLVLGAILGSRVNAAAHSKLSNPE